MKRLDELPGPKGLPWVGNMLRLDLGRLHQVLLEWAREYGGLYRFLLGRQPVMVITDPEVNQLILKQRPKVYRRLGTIESVFEEMGIDGVFSAEGEAWKRQRRVIAHALDGAHVKRFFPRMQPVVERLKKRWERAASEGQEVDAPQDLMRFTVDVTTSLAFGYDMNTLEKDGDVIQDHLERIFPMINRRVNAPWAYWKVLKLPADRALDRSLAAIREAIQLFVVRARERLEGNTGLSGEPSNLLEVMMTLREEGEAAFTDDEIYGNVLTLLLAGEDTTANTMAWMLHYMADHPGIQERMRQESVAVGGESGLLRELSEVDRLQFMDAVAQETMRLKPVAPVLFLEPLEAVQIEEVSVPAGTPLMLLTLHGCLQNSNFGAAKEFRPERWISAAASASTSPSASGVAAPTTSGCPHHVRAFVPFGGGPRFCPGRQLALVEIKAVMAMLCANFEVSKVEPDREVGERFAFSMMPDRLRMRFKRRQV